VTSVLLDVVWVVSKNFWSTVQHRVWISKSFTNTRVAELVHLGTNSWEWRMTQNPNVLADTHFSFCKGVSVTGVVLFSTSAINVANRFDSTLH
jgi:hypothetical protein